MDVDIERKPENGNIGCHRQIEYKENETNIIKEDIEPTVFLVSVLSCFNFCVDSP